MLPLILASTSIYRKELLSRLGLPFQVESPGVDEDNFKQKDLSPLQVATLLAREKARALATPTNCVIGGDQLIDFEGRILGKPVTFDNAFIQLSKMSGKTHELITAVSVFYAGNETQIINRTLLTMRTLNQKQIESYLSADKPFDCAGSYKIEKRGISLFEKIICEDFSAIQGLPLMELTRVLAQKGYPV